VATAREDAGLNFNNMPFKAIARDLAEPAKLVPSIKRGLLRKLKVQRRPGPSSTVGRRSL
jgi:hypothetical protein